jgi:AcrR family transcriptional regulator
LRSKVNTKNVKKGKTHVESLDYFNGINFLKPNLTKSLSCRQIFNINMISIQIQLSDKLYLRDPQQTKLGRKIIEQGIILIDELGFERFTFKKLAEKIASTEASVYRYFENKHKFLLYLVSWYWEWVKYQIEFNTINIDNPKKNLKITLSMLVESTLTNPAVPHVDEAILHRIVVSEGVKAYHSKDVDEENKAGLYVTYKSLCKTLADKILAVSPEFPYAQTLATTLLDMSNNNIYYAQHLPSLTNIKLTNENLTELIALLELFTCRLLQIESL